MNLLTVVRDECIVAGASVTAKQDILAEIAAVAKKSPILDNIDEKVLFKALSDREQIGTTGFGNGVAIPHCRLPEVKDFVVGLVSAPQGVQFDALDDAPVEFFVFIVGPESGSNDHIKILSAISQILNTPGAFESFVKAGSAEALKESFLRLARDEGDDKENRNNKNLFRVVIQDEDLFHDVLKVFAGFTSTTIVVAEAEGSSNYLTKMPLFSGFWSDTKSDFCKVIHATVEKKFTNETIRRIEQETGSLNDRDDIMLMVHDLFYCAGNLNL